MNFLYSFLSENKNIKCLQTMNGMKGNLTLVILCVTKFYSQKVSTNFHSVIYLLVSSPTCFSLT